VRVRTGAAIFAVVAGLAVVGLMAWTLVGMVRSASRRSRGTSMPPVVPPPTDPERGSQNGSGDDA
jgi:hypothetical protein